MPWNFNLVLLSEVAEIWRQLQAHFKFGARVSRMAIEKHWDDILACVRDWARAKAQPESPFFVLSAAMFGDAELLLDLQSKWKRVRKYRRRGYEFVEVLALVLLIHFWRAVRNAHRYLAEPNVPPRGWANPFWSVNDDRLARDLETAVDDLFFREDNEADDQGNRVVPFSELEPAGGGVAPDFDRAYHGLTADEATSGSTELTKYLAHLKQVLSPEEYNLFLDWCDNRERDNKTTIADRHGCSAQSLTRLVARVATILSQIPRTGGQR